MSEIFQPGDMKPKLWALLVLHGKGKGKLRCLFGGIPKLYDSLQIAENMALWLNGDKGKPLLKVVEVEVREVSVGADINIRALEPRGAE